MTQTAKREIPFLRFGILLAPAIVGLAWLTERLSYYWNNDPDLSFGWIVLMLSGYILYETVENAKDPVPRISILSLILYLGGFCLLAIFQVYTAAMGVMPAAIWGLAIGYFLIVIANVGSTVEREDFFRFVFGFSFVLVSLPLPSTVDRILVGGLQNLVASWVVETLNIIGIPASKEGSLVRLPSGMVGVDEACSGIRSLQSAVMATLFIGYLTLKRLDTRVVLFVLGCGLAVVGNLFRALFLSLSAARHGVEAVDDVHDAAGWGILAFTVIGVGIAAFAIQKLELKMKLLMEDEG